MMTPGETISATSVREVQEEVGIVVEVVSLVGVYSNTQYVVGYSDCEVRQEYSICFVRKRIGGEVATSDEVSEVGHFSLDELGSMDIHPSARLRIRHFLENWDEAYLG